MAALEQSDIKALTKEIQSIKGQLATIPRKVLETKIVVKNGKPKELSLQDAIAQNWEKTHKIAEGDIFITLEDNDGYEQNWKLKELLTKLFHRPTDTLNKTLTNFDKIQKLLSFLETIGIGYLIYLFTGGAGGK